MRACRRVADRTFFRDGAVCICVVMTVDCQAEVPLCSPMTLNTAFSRIMTSYVLHAHTCMHCPSLYALTLLHQSPDLYCAVQVLHSQSICLRYQGTMQQPQHMTP